MAKERRMIGTAGAGDIVAQVKASDDNAVAELERADGLFAIVFDPRVDIGPSKSGKTNKCASTGGFTMVLPGGLKVNLNVVRPRS